MALDFKKASKDLLLDLINTKATRTLLKEELQFGTPTTTSDNGKNTVIQLDAAPDAANLQGTQQFYYDRLDLTEVFKDVQAQLTMAASGDTVSSADVVAQVAALTGLGISSEDIVVEELDVSGKPATVTLTAAAAGLVYTGTLQVNMQYVQVEKDKLEEVLAANVADGFTKPEVAIGG